MLCSPLTVSDLRGILNPLWVDKLVLGDSVGGLFLALDGGLVSGSPQKDETMPWTTTFLDEVTVEGSWVSSGPSSADEASQYSRSASPLPFKAAGGARRVARSIGVGRGDSQRGGQRGELVLARCWRWCNC